MYNIKALISTFMYHQESVAMLWRYTDS